MPNLKAHSHTYPHPQKIRFNAVVKQLTVAETLIWSGYFMNNAVAAIFLADRIALDPVRAIGFGYAIFLITRAILQIPIAKYIDKRTGEKDELFAILGSGLLMSIAMFFYFFVTHEFHLYILQALTGVGAALFIPAFEKVFNKNTDKDGEGVDYAVRDTIVTLVAALLVATAGYIVDKTGNFAYLFFPASFLALIGALSVLPLLHKKTLK
jgi:MFS family permease